LRLGAGISGHAGDPDGSPMAAQGGRFGGGGRPAVPPLSALCGPLLPGGHLLRGRPAHVVSVGGTAGFPPGPPPVLRRPCGGNSPAESSGSVGGLGSGHPAPVH